MMLGRGRVSIKIVSLLVLLGLCLYSCGGSDADPMTSTGTPTDTPANIPTKTLSWQAPTSYTDGTPINSETDIQSFEVYVKETPSFGSERRRDSLGRSYGQVFQPCIVVPRHIPRGYVLRFYPGDYEIRRGIRLFHPRVVLPLIQSA